MARQIKGSSCLMLISLLRISLLWFFKTTKNFASDFMGHIFCYCVHKIEILLMRFLANATFSRFQKQHKARTLCTATEMLTLSDDTIFRLNCNITNPSFFVNLHSSLYCYENLAGNIGRFWCKNRPFYQGKHGESWSSEDPHCSVLKHVSNDSF